MKRKSMLLGFLCVFLMISLFTIGSIKSKSLKGTDDQAKVAVSQLQGDYKPWFKSIWEPGSDKIEGTIFALQAGSGIAFIIYYIGRKKHAKANNGTVKN